MSKLDEALEREGLLEKCAGATRKYKMAALRNRQIDQWKHERAVEKGTDLESRLRRAALKREARRALDVEVRSYVEYLRVRFAEIMAGLDTSMARKVAVAFAVKVMRMDGRDVAKDFQISRDNVYALAMRGERYLREVMLPRDLEMFDNLHLIRQKMGE